MAHLAAIDQQLSTLLSSKFHGLETSLHSIEERVAPLSQPILIYRRVSKQLPLLCKVPRLFEEIFCKTLRTVIEGARYYNMQSLVAEEKYRTKRMATYNFIAEALMGFNQLFSGRRPLDFLSTSLTVDFLSKENQNIENILDNTGMELGFVLLNIQEYVAQQSNQAVQQFQTHTQQQRINYYRESFEGMTEDQLLGFLAAYSTDKEVLGYITEKKKGLSTWGVDIQQK